MPLQLNQLEHQQGCRLLSRLVPHQLLPLELQPLRQLELSLKPPRMNQFLHPLLRRLEHQRLLPPGLLQQRPLKLLHLYPQVLRRVFPLRHQMMRLLFQLALWAHRQPAFRQLRQLVFPWVLLFQNPLMVSLAHLLRLRLAHLQLLQMEFQGFFHPRLVPVPQRQSQMKLRLSRLLMPSLVPSKCYQYQLLWVFPLLLRQLVHHLRRQPQHLLVKLLQNLLAYRLGHRLIPYLQMASLVRKLRIPKVRLQEYRQVPAQVCLQVLPLELPLVSRMGWVPEFLMQLRLAILLVHLREQRLMVSPLTQLLELFLPFQLVLLLVHQPVPLLVSRLVQQVVLELGLLLVRVLGILQVFFLERIRVPLPVQLGVMLGLLPLVPPQEPLPMLRQEPPRVFLLVLLVELPALLLVLLVLLQVLLQVLLLAPLLKHLLGLQQVHRGVRLLEHFRMLLLLSLLMLQVRLLVLLMLALLVLPLVPALVLRLGLQPVFQPAFLLVFLLVLLLALLPVLLLVPLRGMRLVPLLMALLGLLLVRQLALLVVLGVTPLHRHPRLDWLELLAREKHRLLPRGHTGRVHRPQGLLLELAWKLQLA